MHQLQSRCLYPRKNLLQTCYPSISACVRHTIGDIHCICRCNLCLCSQKIRVGRGNSARRGNYCGRGMKGQKARSESKTSSHTSIHCTCGIERLLNNYISYTLANEQNYQQICCDNTCCFQQPTHAGVCLGACQYACKQVCLV